MIRNIFYFLSFLILFISCQHDFNFDRNLADTFDSDSCGISDVSKLDACYKGSVIIKVREAALKQVKFIDGGAIQMSRLPSTMSTFLNDIETKKVERLFPPAGRYEERTRREGLHRWLKVTFDESVDVIATRNKLSALDDVEIAECLPVIELYSLPTNNHLSFNKFSLDRCSFPFFNDPLLSQQWHYNNCGKSNGVPGGVEGADINLYKAWKITTGTPDVIVCVVDGAIDITHPDLVDNLWVNEAELNGQPGVDDDNNGYIDDIYGYCFATNTGDLKSCKNAHGTHVAGTIAARNNNGLGVAGIAGGDGTPDSGVRLMSAAIFTEGEFMDSADAAAAIKYGADNGAVISQNSWGYPYATMPKYLKEAIDYFIKYAGCDNNGNQLPDSPMKGGVVFFAAGNDNREFNSQPASYKEVIAVAAMGPNFKKASYSNYGDWVDITAPGGDIDRFGDRAGVLSTQVPKSKLTFGESYGFKDGTSMACPHASGVGALIVSRFGGQGFTNDMFKEQFFASLLPINIDKENPEYKGKLGIGYLDAYLAVKNRNEGKAPEKVKVLIDKIESDFTKITVYWNVPDDADDGTAWYYKLYYSDEQLTTSNFKKGNLVGDANGFINGIGLKVDDIMSQTIVNLESNTQYYFGIVAYDRWKQPSEVTLFTASTKENEPPIITNMPDEPIVVIGFEGTEYELKIEDSNNHSWNYSMYGDIKGVSHRREGESILIKIRPVLPEGDYGLVIKLVDELGAERLFKIPFRVIAIVPPEVINNISIQLLGIANGKEEINLQNHFKQHPYLPHKYIVHSEDRSVVSVEMSDNSEVLTLIPNKVGETLVKVVVDNGYEKSGITFVVQVTRDKDNAVYSVWPIPVIDNLNAWINPKYDSADFVIRTFVGEQIFRTTKKTNNLNVAAVDLSEISSGTYNLQIITGGETFETTIVKQ